MERDGGVMMASNSDEGTHELRDVLKPEGAEVPFLRAYRKFREEEAKPMVVPPALLEHGRVSVAKAAKLLGVSVGYISGKDGMYRTPRQRLPILKDNTIPLSELHRAYKRLHALKVRQLAKDAADALNTRSEPLWEGHAGIITGRIVWTADEPLFDVLCREDLVGFDYEDVADKLRISKAAARRLIADGTLFAWSGRRCRTIVTHEELDAYKRKLAREQAVAVAA